MRLLTYSDYCALDDDGNRYELIEGVLVEMAAPTAKHQVVVAEFSGQLRNACVPSATWRFFQAPFDVACVARGGAFAEAKNVFQPDVLIYSDATQHTDKGGLNVPQFVLEIALPSTAKLDLGQKRLVYERYGVLEYWLIDPSMRTLKILVRNGAALREAGEYALDQVMSLHAFPEIKIDLRMITSVLDREQGLKPIVIEE